MRLTLRTLLSYLDETLEEPARSELERQIAASEHVSEWVHRTRDVMRRLKLGAPAIDGSGATDDPNTVAEYLDRTLPEESVAEFERVCLESDQMLAEVASCHHVLAMFLTEPPDVDPDTRARMHRLKDDLAAALRAQKTAPADPVTTEEVAAARPQPIAAPAPVPEYLRQESNDSMRRWAPAVAALLLLAITIGFAVGPGGWLRGPTEAAQAGPESPPATPAIEGDSNEDSGEEPLEAEPAPDVEGEASSTDQPDVVATDPGDPGDPGDAAEEPEVPMDAEPEGDPLAEADVTEPFPMAEDEFDPAAEAATDEDPQAIPPAPATPIRFVGPPSALVVHGVGPDAWRRLAPEQPFDAPVRAVSLPAFRSTWALDAVTTLELVGLTDVSLTPRGEDGAPPTVVLTQGRIVLSASAEVADAAPARVDLVIDGVTYQVDLGPDAVLAVEADRFYSPGKLSTEVAAPMAAVARALAGEVGWESQGVVLRTSKPKRWTVTGDAPADAPAGFGEAGWVASLPVAPPDQFAAPALAERVPLDAPVWPVLVALADPEQEPFREVRSLAGRAALALGHPEPLVESFRRAEEEDGWRANLAALREAAARSAEAGVGIERVLVEKYGGAAAADLAELMVGFDAIEIGANPQAVSRGVVPNVIVPLLESEDLASRVLAGLALQEAIGPLERPYDPLDATRKRARVVQALKRRLQQEEVSPAVR